MSTGHIRKRSPGSWELKYNASADPLSGKRRIKYRTVRGSKRDAQRELRRLLGEVDQGIDVDAGKLTVGQYLRVWLDEVRHSVAPNTWEFYQKVIESHLTPYLGNVPLAKLRAVHVQRFYSEMLESGRRDGKGGLSPRSVVHLHRTLSTALKRARQLRLIAASPCDDARPPKVERCTPETLDDESAARLLKASEGTRLKVPVFLALATGLRRGEVLALRWTDLDLESGRLTVNQSLEQTRAGGLRFKEPKTRRSRRSIAISPSVTEVLQQHRVQQLEERLLLGLGRDPEGLVIAEPDGSPVKPLNFSKRFARLCYRAGITLSSFHGLRHAHITNLLLAGIHPKVASERAGHASVAITLDVYSHAVPGLQEDAALRIDQALRSVLEG